MKRSFRKITSKFPLICSLCLADVLTSAVALVATILLFFGFLTEKDDLFLLDRADRSAL